MAQPTTDRRRDERGPLERLQDSSLFRLLRDGGVLALVPIALHIVSALDENRDVACAVARTSNAVVRVDDELSRPENHNLRRLLLQTPAACKDNEGNVR